LKIIWYCPGIGQEPRYGEIYSGAFKWYAFQCTREGLAYLKAQKSGKPSGSEEYSAIERAEEFIRRMLDEQGGDPDG